MGFRLVRRLLVGLVCLGAFALREGPAVVRAGAVWRRRAVDSRWTHRTRTTCFSGPRTGGCMSRTDGGRNWVRLAQIAKRNDLVIDHILVDPTNCASPDCRVRFISTVPTAGCTSANDGGKNWYDQAQMRGQSVRSMARSALEPEGDRGGHAAGCVPLERQWRALAAD